MVQLTSQEQAMLEGKEGRLKQVAMENIVRYAEILGARELCVVTKATVFCGAHNYLKVIDSQDPEEVFSRMNLLREENIPFDAIDADCYCQSCVSACDLTKYRELGQSEQTFCLNQRYLEIARAAGVILTGSCSPYLTGWLPVKGEHFVTTESGVTIIGNSLWAACGNSDGIEAAFWSAISGRTPKWGNHLAENRGGTHLIHLAAELSSVLDWDIMGKVVGSRLPSGAVPVVTGNFAGVDFTRLRHFLTTLAISSNCELCHLVGLTPEAPDLATALRGREPQAELTLTREDMAEVYQHMCDDGCGPVDTVSLGCPHYDIHQIQKVASLLRGKKVHPQVHLQIWTVYPIQCMADLNGYTQVIEEAGGHIYSGTCPGTIGECLFEQSASWAVDSLKQSKSIRNLAQTALYYGDMEHCLAAAVSGRWEEGYRWQK